MQLTIDVKKQFKTGGRVILALDIAVTVPDGITVFFGPSGSGKTTILRAIAGIVVPDKGRIALGEQVYFDSGAGINLPMQQRKVGFVFQDYALFPHMTAGENVAYGINSKRVESRENVACGVNSGAYKTKLERVRELLSQFEIGHVSSRYPRELSGGEQQRTALARAFASDPKILLLDEPLSAVDAATRSRLLEEIISVQSESGIPFIYVTHSHAEAARVGNYMFALHEGKVLQEGKPLEIFNAPQSLAVAQTVGTENIFIGDIIEHKSDEGITTVELNGCRIETPYNALPIGSRITVGIRSEDIIVSRERLTQTSARNILEGSVKNIVQDITTTELIVDCGTDFKVSVTAATIKALGLRPGVKVYLLIKARACHILG